MTARTARRLRSIFWITFVCVIYAMLTEVIATAYETGEFNSPTSFGISVGVTLGVSLALLEESRFAERIGHLPFALALVAKTIAYFLILTLVIVFVGLAFGTMTLNAEQTSDPNLFSDAGYYVFVGTTLMLFLIIIFFRQLDRLLGHGVLIKVFLGRYRRPRRESRVFMFLDLKSSTSLAERLSPDAYYSFLNDFFRDLSLPVVNTAGEIYKYVGDEVVITWKQKIGTNNANCLRIFFAIDAAIENRKNYYLDRYGVVPEYKAGAHLGEVISAEIGDLKKEIAYNGDVLNTAARIQSVCNEMEQRFVVSKQLISEVVVPDNISVVQLGSVALRGKAEPLELVGLT